MHIVGALLGAVLTGLAWWVMFGNGREAIDMWLDRRADAEKAGAGAADSLRARESEKRAPLRALTDPREAAVAVLVAISEARGTLTDEQRREIFAQMRIVLGYDDKLDHVFAVAQHASRSAAAPATVIDETAALFERWLDERERGELVGMAEAVAALHGGATDGQALLIRKLARRLGQDRSAEI